MQPHGVTQERLQEPSPAARPEDAHTRTCLQPPRAGLSSPDPLAQPSIDLGYFSGPGGAADLGTLRCGLRLARDIAGRGPLGSYITEERFPGPAAGDWSSDAQLDEFIRRSACSGNALVGTCK
jgi:choline dehydrogenase-like flavoprotein